MGACASVRPPPEKVTDLRGKTIIVTGGSKGLGAAFCQQLVGSGSRTSQEVNEVAQKLQQIATNGTQFTHAELDLTSFASVRKFAARFHSHGAPVHALILNAAAQFPERKETSEGLEATLATNHYGHFLLSTLLSDALALGAPSRVVVVSCPVYAQAKLDLEQAAFKDNYTPETAYATSKLMNVLFAMELNRRHQTAGTGVVVDSFIPTGADVQKSAHALVTVCTSEQLKSGGGRVFSNDKPGAAAAVALDSGMADQLWTTSARFVGYTPEIRTAEEARKAPPPAGVRMAAVRRQSVAVRRESLTPAKTGDTAPRRVSVQASPPASPSTTQPESSPAAQRNPEPSGTDETHQEVQEQARQAEQQAMQYAAMAERKASQVQEVLQGVEHTASFARNLSTDARRASLHASDSATRAKKPSDTPTP